MIGNAALIRVIWMHACALALGTTALALFGAETTITKTNWSERWITNVIEVTIPSNRFVNEYHTNWTTRTVTNLVTMEALRTNLVTACQTNWITRTLTNTVVVNLLRTNFVDQYHTNWSTLNLTNWETVVLFKTNRSTQTVTNVVQAEMSPQPAVAAPTQSVESTPKQAAVQTAAPVPAPWTGPLAIQAARTARPPANNMVEVQLKVRWTDSTPAQPRVQNWRLEREDAAILLFGQEQEFKRQLPFGEYKVEARLKAEGDSSPLSVRGTLSVTASGATIQQRSPIRR